MNNVTKMPPRRWKPTADQLRAMRAYCAKVEGKRPRQIVIELGERYNIDDPQVETSANLCLVSKGGDAMNPDWGWDDTDLHSHTEWSFFRRFGIELDRRGCCVIDFYIGQLENFGYGFERGELLGNAQVYVRTIDGVPTIVGFSATCHPFQAEEIA